MPYRSLSDHSPEELKGYNLHDFHLAAAKGDDIQVAQYIAVRPDLLEEGDQNGFRAIHEAVRHGHKVSTQLLINAGADINARTGSYNDGWSPLGLAMHFFDEEHPVARLLRSRNAEVHLPGEGSA
jgi:ankyrin repeat protein